MQCLVSSTKIEHFFASFLHTLKFLLFYFIVWGSEDDRKHEWDKFSGCTLLVQVSLQTWHCILSAILVFLWVFSSCTGNWFGDLSWNLCSFPTPMLWTSSSMWFLFFHWTIRGREERANGHQKCFWLPTSVFLFGYTF